MEPFNAFTTYEIEIHIVVYVRSDSNYLFIKVMIGYHCKCRDISRYTITYNKVSGILPYRSLANFTRQFTILPVDWMIINKF